MKKITWTILIVFIVSFASFAQQADRPVGEPDPNKLGIDSAQQNLEDITITKFEDAGFWFATIPRDQGIISWRRLEGEPIARANLDAERMKNEEALNIPKGKYVLGVRVDFYKRGMNAFNIYPMRPLAIEGIAKTISVWVIGRNFNHTLKIILSDYFGRTQALTLGKLNFTGWKRMTVAIPPGIVQTDYHYVNNNGLKFIGFVVECDLLETRGRFYLYFDDMSAVTDLFLESNLDRDDMEDIW